jgi:hypothetical protein
MANPAAIAPGQLAQALNDQDRIRRSTKIQLYYSCKEKDTISAYLLIDRITKAVEITA